MNRCFICDNQVEKSIQVLIPDLPAVHLCADCVDGMDNNVGDLMIFLDKIRQLKKTNEDCLTVGDAHNCVTCGNAMNSDYRCVSCLKYSNNGVTILRTNWHPKEEKDNE